MHNITGTCEKSEKERKKMSIVSEKSIVDELRLREGRIAELESFENHLRDQLEHYRKESEQLGNLIETSPVIVCVADINGKTTYVNAKFEEVTGYSREEVLGRLWFKLGIVTAGNTRLLLNRATQKLMGRPPSSMEIKIRRKTGEYAWISGIGQLIKENGKPVSFHIIANEVTELVQAREGLKESEQKFRGLADQSPNIIVIRKDNRIVYVNERCVEITGFSKKELYHHRFDLAKVISKAISPEYIPAINENANRHQRGEEVAPLECALVTRTGRRIEAILYTKLINFEGGNAVLATVVDITQRKKAEESLIHAAEEWRETFDSIPDLVSIHDKDGKIVRANKAFAKALNMKPQDVVGKTCYSLIHGLDKPPQNCPRLRALESQKPVMEELFVSHLGMHLQIIASPLIDSNRSYDSNWTVHVARDIGERMIAEEQRSKGLEKLLDTLESTVAAIATTAEIRDPYTAGHQRRVSQLAYAIAKDIGLPEDQTQGIRLAGLVHDIGKIYIPAEILSKPGDLMDIEHNMIKMHSKIGYDILSRVEFPWPIAEAVLQHHERIDRSGYPDGLSGEDILLEAKVLGVADVVEAMSSHRPYRPALSLEEALQEISSKSGICYDRQVVESCVKLFTAGLIRFH